jgi:D-alanyl-D-alanine-carboxypeptidase/D-alanyl-D-alanine-endopeptidase
MKKQNSIRSALQLCILLLFSSYCFAQQNAKLDTIVRHATRSLINNRPWMGCSAAVIKNGKTYFYHSGSVNEQTLYEIGSVSKSFSSLILAHAVLEKRVKLTDDIRKYLAGNYPNLACHDQPIQLLHLVNLTSGLPNNMPDGPDDFKRLNDDTMPFAFVKSHQNYTREDLLRGLHRVRLDTVPGFKPGHSNSAAKLLIYLLENIYHEPYAVLLQRYILHPLHMNHTYLTVPVNSLGDIAKGYTPEGLLMPYVPEYDVPAIALKSTIGDMAKYTNYQLDEKDPAVKMTHQVTWGDAHHFALGMNWFLDVTGDGKRKVSSDGTTFGFTAYILLYPGIKYGVALLTNEYDNDSNTRLENLAKGIFEEDHYTSAQRASDGFGFSTSINLLSNDLKKTGFTRAAAVATKLKRHMPQFRLEENEVNNWAYTLLGKGKKMEALEIFKLNVSLYPASWNTYDSLGDGYTAVRDTALAIKNYQRSLELNPKNQNAADQLKKLSKN